MSKKEEIIAEEGAWYIRRGHGNTYSVGLGHACGLDDLQSSSDLWPGRSETYGMNPMCPVCGKYPPSKIEAMWRLALMCKPKPSIHLGEVTLTGVYGDAKGLEKALLGFTKK